MGGRRLEDLIKVSTTINQAALLQVSWQDALSALSKAVGGVFATFELIDKSSQRVIEFHASSGPEISQDYLAYYMPRNPRIRHGMRRDAPRIVVDGQFISERDMDRDEFYIDFLKPFDLRYFMAFKTLDTRDVTGAFTIQRSTSQGHADQIEVRTLTHLAPTLVSAAQTYCTHAVTLSRCHAVRGWSRLSIRLCKE